MIYLDNAATTKVSDEVLSAMLPYFTEVYGNPGSIHSVGREAAAAIKKAREQVAKPINADPNCIIFTSGGSEANTLAITGLADYLQSVGKTHIITLSVEHHSVLEATKSMFYKGFEVTYLPVTERGFLRNETFEKAIQDNTGLVSIMRVNNETGNLYNIKEIGRICKERGILFHTDCVQAYGVADIDVEAMNIDFLSVSGHKFHAPKGVGFLYAKNKELLSPLILGGGQENGLRSGTENVASIVGIGKAAELLGNRQMVTWENCSKRNYFLECLRNEAIEFTVNGAPYNGSKTVNLRFDGVDGETLLLLLNSKGVIVSAGSACSAHSAVPSHVLTAIHLKEEQAKSSIRISFSEYITDEEICEAAKIIADSVKQLQRR